MSKRVHYVVDGTYYLNNTGSRWVEFKNGRKPTITLETKNGYRVTRTVQFYEQWGNFALAYISYKGKRISVFSDTVLED